MRFGKIFLILFLFWTSTAFPFYEGDSTKSRYDVMLDSLFNDLNIDTSGITASFLTANVKDWSSFKSALPLDENSCRDYFIVLPNFEFFINEDELKFVLAAADTNVEFLFRFLEDNFITSNFFKVYIDSNHTTIKLVQLGTDINVNFAEPVALSIYEEGVIRFYLNLECKKFYGKQSARFFYYDNNKIISEKILVDNDSQILYMESGGGEIIRQIFEK